MLPTSHSGVQSSRSCTGLSGPCDGPCSEPWSGGLGWLLTRGWFVYLCVSVFVYVCVHMWLCACTCVSLAGYSCLYVPACMFARVPCVCLCHSVGVYVCCLCLGVDLCVCLCLCTAVGASLVVTLRGRGLLVHAYQPVARLGLVPSWVLPCSSGGPPHQTSLHCPAFCICRERRGGDPWRRFCLRAVLVYSSRP